MPAPALPDVTAHPAVRAEQAAIESVQARERALGRSYTPRVDIQGAVSGRGTGAEVPGLPRNADGLGLDAGNWALGVTISFPVLEGFAVNARKRVEAQNEIAERARHEQAIQRVTTDQARAQALITAAAEIARNTPVELKAAADAESRARARYSNGLATVTDVADAQRLLAQAEADEAITPFLERLRQP